MLAAGAHMRDLTAQMRVKEPVDALESLAEVVCRFLKASKWHTRTSESTPTVHYVHYVHYVMSCSLF